MRQITQDGLTSNRAIRAAMDSGEYYFRRHASNRWLVYQRGEAVFGFGPKPQTLDGCNRWVALAANAKTNTYCL